MAIHGDPIQASGQPKVQLISAAEAVYRKVILYSLFCCSEGGGPAGPEGFPNSAAMETHIYTHTHGTGSLSRTKVRGIIVFGLIWDILILDEANKTRRIAPILTF